MKKGLTFATLFFFASICTVNVHAQELQFGLDVQLGVPQKEFNTQMGNRLGFGVGGMFGVRLPDTPILVGVDLGFMNFGTETRDEPLSTTIPDIRVEVENSYNLFHGDLLLRMIPPGGAVRPYLDGLVGFNHFFTETVLRERGGFGSQPDVLRDTNFRDTSLSYGFGAGFLFRVYSDDGSREVNSDEFSGPYSVYIHFNSRYMFGREAEYLREGSIIRENGNVTFDVIRSKTDLLYFKLGVTVEF